MQLRASSLPIIAHCTGPLVLPCSEEKSEKAEKAADWGKMVHYWAQTGEIVHDSARMANAFRRALEASGVARTDLWLSGGNHEGTVALAVDGSGETSRDDTARPGWITGHYDYQWWLVEGELWVDDLKTGKLYPNPAPGFEGHVWGMEEGENRFPPKADSEQMRMYALTLSELLGYRGSVIVSVTHWPRLPLWARHSKPTRRWCRYTHDELMAYWDELENMYRAKEHNERVLAGDAEALMWLNPGDHCKFCPVIDCFVRQ